MMKTITFSIDEKLLEAAEARARTENTTLEELFRMWLADYARQRPHSEEFRSIYDPYKR